MSEQTTDLKDLWEKNKAQFEQLCQEQERLYNPDFEKVFVALYEIAPEQKEVLNTNCWDMGKELPEAVNTEAIKRAIKTIGLPDGEGANFLRYAEIVLRGKKLMQANALLNLKIELATRPQQAKPDGWRFYPVNIIASPQLHNAFNEVIKRQAANGDGIFSNITEIAEQPDIEFDELLGVEVYNISCSYVPYYDDLKNYGVISTTLGKPFAKYLFINLKELATYIKENTDKPEAVKAQIFKIIKDLDNMPIWGLLFQILILQGLCSLLENCNIAEGDNGYNEATSLFKWLSKLLTDKLIKFTLTGRFYGDGDLKRLQPFCDYLYSTEIGRCVQKVMFNGNSQEGEAITDNTELPSNNQTATKQGLPKCFDTPQGRQIFQNAVDGGLLTNYDYKPTQKATKGRLAIFATELGKKLNITDFNAKCEQFWGLKHLAQEFQKVSVQKNFDKLETEIKQYFITEE